HPHLQFPAGAGDRPPHQPDALQARQGDRRRRAGRTYRCADHREPGSPARRDGGHLLTLTVGAAWRGVRDLFRRAGIDTAELDARIFAEVAFGMDRLTLVNRERDKPTPEQLGALEALAARRLKGEPVSRIIGE